TRHALLSDAPVFYVCLHLNFIRLQHYLDMNRVIFLCDSNGMNDTLRQSISSLLDQIITNYKSDIRLADLAEQLYLSPAYLSKYIKTRLHMNFVDYVNSIRLFHAVAEIRNSEKKITNIAIDNGFSNLTAFSHAFKKFYDMTPSEFRAREKEKKQAGQAGALDAKIAKKAEDYLKNRSASAPEQALSRQYLIADAHNQKIYSKYWKRMININRMSDLFQSDIQSHILLLKHELDFEYIRFRDIYSEELELNIGGNGDYYFEKMDRVMDFLIHHGIHPYIEIGFKPEMLVERLDQYLVAEHKEILFKTYAEAKYFFHSMISHYANRYGIAEIELWYFELWKDPRLLKKHDYQDYFTAFEACYDAIKEISPNIRIGGGSIHMTFDEPIFAEFLSHWKQRIVNPDFLSIYSYPYYTGSAGRAIDRRRSQDTGYLKKTVETITDKLARIGFHVKEIHVSEWNGSVSNRNPMNDSIWQGAYVMKNIIDNLGGISLLGYWLGSDLFSRHNYTNDILNEKSRQPPAALRQRLWPLAGVRHLVIPPGPGALADPLDDLLAVQSQAQRPGHLRGADTSEIMGKSVGAQYRNRFKGTGAVHLHVTAEFGRAGHRKVTCHTPTNHHADWSGGCT
ncbi:MAG: helix-turn-helix domain-containing protein, partial [Ruminococcus sp.]|nr:helix-turn-helix domain-containing protein [Ruminococcus sp.]